MRRTRFCLAVLVFGAVHGVVNAEPMQWSVGAGGNDHYYEYIGVGGLYWTEVVDLAQEREYLGVTGHLASITSQEENDFLFNVVGPQQRWIAWLGGWQEEQMPPADGWHWVTGEPWSFTNWVPGQPSGVDGKGREQRYLAMWGRGTSGPSRWDDDANDTHPWDTNGYFVEYPVPEPSALVLFATAALALAAHAWRRRWKRG